MVTDDLLWSLYRTMFQIRYVEESFLRLYDRGLIFGTVHTCIGQEVCAVGVTHALVEDKDIVWSGHRGHGHYLGFTGDLKGLVSELLASASGACGGGKSTSANAARFLQQRHSFNIASLWKLPVLFVLEDNGIAQSTPKKYEHAGDFAARCGDPASKSDAPRGHSSLSWILTALLPTAKGTILEIPKR